jgi:hypothetical protein
VLTEELTETLFVIDADELALLEAYEAEKFADALELLESYEAEEFADALELLEAYETEEFADALELLETLVLALDVAVLLDVKDCFSG